MNPRIAWRILGEVEPRLLWNLAYRCGWGAMRSINRFNRGLKRNEYFPAFLFLSITNRCNFSCQGCWVTQTVPPRELPLPVLNRVITESKAEGISFFGILGGEPLLHEGLFDLFDAHRDAYFVLFTNGVFLQAEAAAKLRRSGNVTPLISIEGTGEESDARRGGTGVYAAALDALGHCHENRLFTGVATSITRHNLGEHASVRFLDEMARRGAHYLWYYIYRPVGPRPSPERALTEDQILQLRRFIVDARLHAPLILVDAYWDHEGRALCPAVSGIAPHIAPNGAIEPCPVVQVASGNIGGGNGLSGALRHSALLEAFRTEVSARTRGCIIMEDPQWLAEFVRAQMKACGAVDSTGRNAFLDELAAAAPYPSHHIPGAEIPEKSRLYRFAKKHWFFGFGAYG